MKRWLVRALLAMVMLLAALVLWGMALPEAHVARVTRVVPGSPEEVWAVVTDVESFPEWRPDVERVERLPRPDGVLSWREHGPGGPLGLEVVRSDPPTTMVTRILEEGQPFGGTWTYRLEATAGGTRVTLQEDGHVRSALFRVVGRYLLGYDATMKRYLEALVGRMERAR